MATQDEHEVLPRRYPASEMTVVLIGSEEACQSFWRTRIAAPHISGARPAQVSTSVQEVAGLRMIDPARIIEILLMPDFNEMADYAGFCAELSSLDAIYSIPIRSGEALG